MCYWTIVELTEGGHPVEYIKHYNLRLLHTIYVTISHPLSNDTTLFLYVKSFISAVVSARKLLEKVGVAI